MDTVTEAALASTLDTVGGFGTIHRFLTVSGQVEEAARATDGDNTVGAAIGINEDYITRTEAVVEAGAAAVMVDVAHGHLEQTLDAVRQIRDTFPEIALIAGNVATSAGVEDLYSAGADCVKVGIGPGSHCTTRQVAGAGVPQLTAVDDCSEVAHDLGISLIADGGIHTSGDAVKALMAGADTVMMGSLFAGTQEAPGEIIERNGQQHKRSRGMATTAAAKAREDKEETVQAAEGVEGLTLYKGPVEAVCETFCAGIRSGLSYCGGYTIPEARENAEFIRAAPSAQKRAGAHTHTDHEWETIGIDNTVNTKANVHTDD